MYINNNYLIESVFVVNRYLLIENTFNFTHMGEFYQNIEKIVQKQMYENKENAFRIFFLFL